MWLLFSKAAHPLIRPSQQAWGARVWGERFALTNEETRGQGRCRGFATHLKAGLYQSSVSQLCLSFQSTPSCSPASRLLLANARVVCVKISLSLEPASSLFSSSVPSFHSFFFPQYCHSSGDLLIGPLLNSYSRPGNGKPIDTKEMGEERQGGWISNQMMFNLLQALVPQGSTSHPFPHLHLQPGFLAVSRGQAASASLCGSAQQGVRAQALGQHYQV